MTEQAKSVVPAVGHNSYTVTRFAAFPIPSLTPPEQTTAQVEG